MDIVAIVQHPLTAIGVAGFFVLQVYQLSRWTERQADLAWWGTAIEDAAGVYLRATGKSLGGLEHADIDQIAAAVGCRADIARWCLRDLARRQVVAR
ncbi:MAG: hypothetical protein IT340_08945 [Chloroflexi bacterium]|nr:hypothetical protein [Chloroflexota bacterium]